MNEKIEKLSKKLFSILDFIVSSLTFSNDNHFDIFRMLINKYDGDRFKELSNQVYFNIKQSIETNQNGIEELTISIFERYYNSDNDLKKYLSGFNDNVKTKVKNNEIEYEDFSNIVDFVERLKEDIYETHSLTDYLYWLLIDNFATDNNKSTLEESYCKKNQALEKYRIEKLQFNRIKPNQNLINTAFKEMLIYYYGKSKRKFDNSYNRNTKIRFENFIEIIKDKKRDTSKKIVAYISDLKCVEEYIIKHKTIKNDKKNEILNKIDSDLKILNMFLNELH